MAGAFLITPGFLTDFIGFTITIPVTRRIIALMLLKRLSARAEFRKKPFVLGGGPYKKPETPGPVIEGEYENKDQSM